jgi:acetyltransferase-like isoleucine patch superfamily enzyme
MGIINKIKKRIEYYFLSKVKPEIIGGFKNKNGQINKDIGISNLTHISNKNEHLYIGNNVFIGHFNYIDAFNAKITISDNVQITNYVSILTHSSHNEIRFSLNKKISGEEYPDLFLRGEVFIGEYTYIGPHSVIMPKTKIGKGCIISAYSYVKGDFPDYSIIRGIPAKIIGDSRKLDSELLKTYPEINKSYYLKNEPN